MQPLSTDVHARAEALTAGAMCRPMNLAIHLKQCALTEQPSLPIVMKRKNPEPCYPAMNKAKLPQPQNPQKKEKIQKQSNHRRSAMHFRAHAGNLFQVHLSAGWPISPFVTAANQAPMSQKLQHPPHKQESPEVANVRRTVLASRLRGSDLHGISDLRCREGTEGQQTGPRTRPAKLSSCPSQGLQTSAASKLWLLTCSVLRVPLQRRSW